MLCSQNANLLFWRVCVLIQNTCASTKKINRYIRFQLANSGVCVCQWRTNEKNQTNKQFLSNRSAFVQLDISQLTIRALQICVYTQWLMSMAYVTALALAVSVCLFRFLLGCIEIPIKQFHWLNLSVFSTEMEFQNGHNRIRKYVYCLSKKEWLTARRNACAMAEIDIDGENYSR